MKSAIPIDLHTVLAPLTHRRANSLDIQGHRSYSTSLPVHELTMIPKQMSIFTDKNQITTKNSHFVCCKSVVLRISCLVFSFRCINSSLQMLSSRLANAIWSLTSNEMGSTWVTKVYKSIRVDQASLAIHLISNKCFNVFELVFGLDNLLFQRCLSIVHCWWTMQKLFDA